MEGGDSGVQVLVPEDRIEAALGVLDRSSKESAGSIPDWGTGLKAVSDPRARIKKRDRLSTVSQGSRSAPITRV